MIIYILARIINILNIKNTTINGNLRQLKLINYFVLFYIHNCFSIKVPLELSFGWKYISPPMTPFSYSTTYSLTLSGFAKSSFTNPVYGLAMLLFLKAQNKYRFFLPVYLLKKIMSIEIMCCKCNDYFGSQL